MPPFMNAINNLTKIKSSSLHLLLPNGACFESVGSAFENRLFLSLLRDIFSLSLCLMSLQGLEPKEKND